MLFIRAAAQRNEHQTAAEFAEELFCSPNTAILLCKKGGKKEKYLQCQKKMKSRLPVSDTKGILSIQIQLKKFS